MKTMQLISMLEWAARKQENQAVRDMLVLGARRLFELHDENLTLKAEILKLRSKESNEIQIQSSETRS
jgi:hypothetical protein